MKYEHGFYCRTWRDIASKRSCPRGKELQVVVAAEGARALDRMRCLISVASDVSHLQQIVTGFTLLASQRRITLRQR